MRKRILSMLVLLVAVTGAVAQAATKTVTWDSSIISTLVQNKTYTDANGITVSGDDALTKNWRGTSMFSFENYDGVDNVVFSLSNGNFTSIVINCSDISIEDASLDNGFTQNGNSVTWSGNANTITLKAISDYGFISFFPTSIVFTIEAPAVTLTDGNEISALLPYAGKTCDVSFVRSFAASRPSTVCLPFAYAPKSGEKFYTFVGITWNQIANEYYADMIEYTGTTLTANTPYLYLPSSTGDVDFGGTYTIPATIEAGTTTSGEWKFIGTYTGLTYGTGSFSGNVYGFAAEDNGTVERGQFIKGTTGATVPPMRCYLTYNNGEQFNAKTRAATELPSIIRVRLLDSNGNVTTGIGTLNTRTGEFSADDSWYTIGGQKLPEKPVKKGVYINNGTKVLIK